MDQPSTRRLNLSDLAILIAATAVGVWIVKAVHESRITTPIPGYTTPWSWWIGREASPFLVTTAAGLLAVRSLRPRPEARELFRQPGVIACLAILIGMALGVFFRLGHLWVAGLRNSGINYSLDNYLANGMGTGNLIAVSWATLALAGAWRPVSDWVDRAGRILGGFAIVLWVATGLFL